jgi:hypothetical protein
MRFLSGTLLALAVGLVAAAPALAAPASTWSKAVNAICVQAHQAAEGLNEPLSRSELIVNVQKLVTISTRQVKAIARLPRPAAQAATIARTVTLWNQEVALQKKLVAALRRNDVAAQTRLVRQDGNLGEQIARLETKLGVTECQG